MKVTFKKSVLWAMDGIHPVQFEAGQEYELDEAAIERATQKGWIGGDEKPVAKPKTKKADKNEGDK